MLQLILAGTRYCCAPICRDARMQTDSAPTRALAVPAAAQDAPGTCGDLSIAQMGWTSAEIITEEVSNIMKKSTKIISGNFAFC